MKKWLPILFLLTFLAVPASALELEAPAVPEAGEALIPENTGSFADGLRELTKKAVDRVSPDLSGAGKTAAGITAAVILLSLMNLLPGEKAGTQSLVGAVSISALLLGNADVMIRLASDTVTEIASYGKLLLPVMTAAMAAQGGTASSAGLYLGTAFFSSLLGNLLSRVFVPGVYVFLALAVGNCACAEELLKKLKDMIKNLISWSLKTLLTVFTTYMSITGVVSGTTDAAALKAAKVTISSFVPVVGGILSDASEAVLVGAGVMKNTAGIYGIFAVLSLFLEPFARIGVQYLTLKATAALCGLFSACGTSGLIEDFSAAMGLLLGITGAMCLLILISTVCFLRGVG